MLLQAKVTESPMLLQARLQLSIWPFSQLASRLSSQPSSIVCLEE